MKAVLPDDEAAPTDTGPTYTGSFWVGLALGTPLIVFGLRGIFDFRSPAVRSFATYFVGGALLHDLVVAPLVCLVGWLVLRVVPPVAKAPVQAALVASAVVGLVAWPYVRGYGMTPGEPSFLSRNYTASVLVTWGVVWAAAAFVVALRVVSARRR